MVTEGELLPLVTRCSRPWKRISVRLQLYTGQQYYGILCLMISNLLLTAKQPSKILQQILEMSAHLSSVCMFEFYICDNILSYSALSILWSSSLQYQFGSRIWVSLVFMLNCSVYHTYNGTLSGLNVLSVPPISLSYVFFFFFNCHYFFCCMSL